jgi:hypothetical protein
MIGYRIRISSNSHDADDAGSAEDRKRASLGVKPAEEVSGEKGHLDLFDPVGPLPPGTIERQEFLVAFAAQRGRSDVAEP